MWGRNSVKVAVATAACSVGLAGGADAATLTLGSQFQGYNTDFFDFNVGGGTVAQTSLPSPLIAVAPVDGTVTQWRFAGYGPSFTPTVIRPQGGGKYAAAVSGPPQTAVPGYAIGGPFPLNLPIRRGDLFGYSATQGSGGLILRTGTTTIFFEPAIDPGGNPEAPDATGTQYELALSAIVRYCVVPDLRKKTPKAARTALAAADCTVGKTKKSKKRKKNKRVLSQSVAPGSQVSDTAPIDLKVSRKS